MGALTRLMRMALPTSALPSTNAHHRSENSGSGWGNSQVPAKAHSTKVKSGPRRKAASAKSAPTLTTRPRAPETHPQETAPIRPPARAGSR